MKSIWIFSVPLLCAFFAVIPLNYAQDYSSPESTFEIFKEAAKNADSQKYIDCTTEESQIILTQRKPTPVQLHNEYNVLANKKYKVDIQGNSATLYFIPGEELSPPYFFKKEKGQWRIDLMAMSDKIYFDQENKWHLRK